MKNNFLTVLSVAVFQYAHAQIGIDSVLKSVSANNKTIQTENSYHQSQTLQYRTGMNPADPFISTDYMKGTPAGAGNQVDIMATQSFEFPTVYFQKRELADAKTLSSSYTVQATRQQILLEAKQTCCRLVFLNKMKNELLRREQHALQIYGTSKTKLANGDADALDLNKARINLITIQNQIRLNESDISYWNQKLTMLNGGLPLSFTDTIYSPEAPVLPFAVLDSVYQTKDPYLAMIQQNCAVTREEIQLNRSLWLPTMETGYHHQSILGQSFNGIHLGMSIPLWQNSNTIKYKEAELLYREAAVNEYRVSQQTQLSQKYSRYSALKVSYSEFTTLTDSVNSHHLLEKSYRGGELSSTEYFVELSYYYTTFDMVLQIEWEYHCAEIELNKYLL